MADLISFGKIPQKWINHLCLVEFVMAYILPSNLLIQVFASSSLEGLQKIFNSFIRENLCPQLKVEKTFVTKFSPQFQQKKCKGNFQWWKNNYNYIENKKKIEKKAKANVSVM